jgi:DNA-binding Xre family transcriptional regulator
MFIVTLQEMMDKRGVSIYRLAMDTRIAPTTLYRMIENRGEQESIDLLVLSKLCTRLECTPNDLLRHVPDNEDMAVRAAMAVKKRPRGRPAKDGGESGKRAVKKGRATE